MSEKLRKWIADFDNGNEIKSILMGGISERYEVAIQDCVIETMRNLQIIALPVENLAFEAAVETAADAAVELLDKTYGFSRAQVKAAKNLAAIFWRQTPEVGLNKMKEQDPKRIIKIRKAENGTVCVSGF